MSLTPEQQDHHEIAEDYIDDLLEVAKGSKLKLIKNLIYKIKALPSLDFSVSEYSIYKSNTWEFTRNEKSQNSTVLFNSNVTGSNSLKKAITYYFIPNNHPFGTVRSFNSTTTYAYGHRWMEEYLLAPNELDATPDDIRLITAKMINEALNTARDKGAKRHYSLLYTYLIFWLSLSSQKLLPDEYRLNVKASLVDTNERRKDLINIAEKTREGWRAFSENEIAKLIEYSLFWLDEGMPQILSLNKYIEKNKFHTKKDAFVTICVKNTENAEFESQFGAQAKGVTIVGFKQSITTKLLRPDMHNNIRYHWRSRHRTATDRVRNAVFMLVCLLIGLRRSELAILRFEDFYCEGGHWFLNVTRFKTSADPNFHGEEDNIPIPSYLGEKVMEYKKLREFHDYMQTGALFQTVIPSRELNKLDRMVSRVAKVLGQETFVDDVHTHRFRKTIAEIIINRSDKNIDLIRLLFGHSSYKMTLRYIARNPYMVGTVVEALKDSYASEFSKIVEAVDHQQYSGDVGHKISNRLAKVKGSLNGEILRIKVHEYISYLVENGDCIFIQQVNLGQTCCYSNTASVVEKLPCHESINFHLEGPVIANCQIDCKFLFIMEPAKKGLENNIRFSEKLLSDSSSKMKNDVRSSINRNLLKNKDHLKSLNDKSQGKKIDQLWATNEQ